jgi:hypothetical protein
MKYSLSDQALKHCFIKETRNDDSHRNEEREKLGRIA